MYQTLIVIDETLDFIDQVRERALQIDYPTLNEKTYFPGKNASQPVPIQGLDQFVGNIVGEKLTPSVGNSHAKFRLALEGDTGKGGVHVDRCQWSGILYLTKDQDCVGGTNFYRHKALNTDKAPLTQDDLNNLGIDSFESFWNDYLLKDQNDASKWELTTHVPMKYNRLVLFRPWLFHNAGPSFGTTKENGRLIYPLFYDQIR